MRGRAIVGALAGAACSAAPPLDIAAIVRSEMSTATASAGTTVHCAEADALGGSVAPGVVMAHLCTQRFTPAANKSYAGLLVVVEKASGATTAASARAVGGPGGASADVTRRTRDGRYDVTASLVTTGLPADQPLRLPDAGQLLDRILARYATQSPARAP